MEQFKLLQEVNLLEGTYYFQTYDVHVQSKVVDVEMLKNCFGEEDLMDIKLEKGHVAIGKFSQVKRINRPSSMAIGFEWCFAIRNQDKEFIGYLGKLES